MIDLSNPEQVKAEAERRARLRAEGKPLRSDGGLARLAQTPPVTRPFAAHASAENTERTGIERSIDVSIGAPPVAWRRGDTLWLLIPATARPKKNSTMLGIKKSPGYIRFKNAVIGAVQPFAHQLRLPLPPIDYNCAAHFYRERDDADTDNLITGLADALQDAGVLEDDFSIRTWNGSDRFVDATHPRVEVTLTPYLGRHT